MRDKLARALISGLAGGIVMDIPDVIFHKLNLSNYSHWDWAYIVTTGRHPGFWGEMVFGELTNLIFTMLLGVLFVFVVSRVITNSNLFLRGLSFATGVWFLINALAIIFKVPNLEITLGLAISNLLTAWIYGLTLASCLHWLDQNNV